MSALMQKAKKGPKAKKPSVNSLTGKATNGLGSTTLTRTSAAAAMSYSIRRVGMSDIRSHVISWLAGYVYVGNGTLGATDSVYMRCGADTTKIVVPNGSDGCNVPVASGDSLVGTSYATDVIKHYSRIRISKCHLELVPLYPSTANSMSVVVAPQRGPKNIGYYSTTNAAAVAYTDVIGMSGADQCASWEAKRFDFTPYIAGGSGSSQNEFDVSNGSSSTSAMDSPAYVSNLVIPCTFAVSGNSSTTALRGTNTHAVIITQVVDLIDFIGNNIPTNTGGLRTSLLRPSDVKDCKSEVSSKLASSADDRKDPPAAAIAVRSTVVPEDLSKSQLFRQLGYVKVSQPSS